MVESNMDGVQSEAPVQAVVTDVPEKTLKQSEVDAIVGRVRGEGREQGRREASEELQKQYAPQAQSYAPPQSNPQNQYAPTPDQIQKMVDDRLKQTEVERHAQKIASEFHAKIATGASKYEDFDKVHQELQQMITPAAYADLAYLANHVDNAADILYTLRKDPRKLAEIAILAGIGEDAAKDGIQQLSQSLKANDQGIRQKQPPKPLDQIKPSNIGVDNGDMKGWSVSDFQQMLKN